MPFPLLLIPITAVALAVGSTAIFAAIPRIWKILDKRTVAILGASQTGKTALVKLLHDIDAPDAALLSAVSGGDRGRFKLEIKGKTIDFAVPRDLPGSDGLNVTEWKDAFAGSDHVWYLFRSDLIASGDEAAIAVVKSHLLLFKAWLNAIQGRKPKILLIGTWADRHPEHMRHPSRVADLVADAGVIRIGSIQLGGASVVVGSLATSRDADRLLKGIKSRLQ